MVGGRQRLVLGVGAGAVAAVVCAVLVSRLVVSAEWWQVRHAVTDRPVAWMERIGPPPGPLAVRWQRSARVHSGPVAGYDSVSYEIVLGQVVTATGRGLEVRDARTGRDRWSYHRVGWTLLGWAATRGQVVGYFERDGRRGEHQMIGFDALSGGMLWRRTGERPAAVGRTTLRWPGGSGVVVTADARRTAVFGRSAESGLRLWKLRLQPGCRLFEDAAHPSDGVEELTAVALDCGRRSRLMALEPASGRVRWIRELRSDVAPEVTALGEVTLVADGTELRAYDRHGTLVGTWDGDVCGDAMCPSALTDGGRLVVVLRTGERPETARMVVVRIADRRIEWERKVPGYTALAHAGDRVYALRPRLAEWLLPAAVDLVDLREGRGGRTTTVPVPFTLDPDLRGVRPWLSAAGGYLFAAVPEAAPRPEGSARLVALSGGPVGPGPDELAGVRPQEWPDACALLTREDLAAAGLADHVARPGRTRVGPVPLPRPVTCTYEPKDRRAADRRPARVSEGLGRRSLTVTVRWTASSGPAASGLLNALQATQSQARRRFDLGGDEAYDIGPTSGTIALRVGRRIVVVSASPPATTPRLARTVATAITRHPAP
ncbi:PQQ-binding-like beta-propeller repeat protein [Actinomadura kijaniata]|uniref:outer membrane protein assembly factor BamB family protein n=1 Tax=Actinomadura kijaniata TaxID=46161 RepID=UPI003F198336